MIYASACDGIGAAHAAWQPLGWSCAWHAEIAPDPASIVAHQWGARAGPNLGDITTLTDPEIERYGPIDLLVGGTPCQSFSVAGLRAGMDDPRGNLALAFLGLAARARPRWVVWENVPGVLSSRGGRDFGAFLGALEELGYGWAYRTLDAQYIRVDSHVRAVPQRRRRVFVVGHLGDPRRAAAVLFERESLRGDPAPRRDAGATVAGTLEARAGTGGYDPGAHGAASGHLIPEVPRSLNAHASRSDSDTETFVAFHATQDPISSSARAPALSGNAFVGVTDGLVVRRLTPRECERLQGLPDDYTRVPRRVYARRRITRLRPADMWDENSDGAWTLVMADGPRYKALGNSMAVNVMSWLGQRIAAVEDVAP